MQEKIELVEQLPQEDKELTLHFFDLLLVKQKMKKMADGFTPVPPDMLRKWEKSYK